jgi:large subunit ribosomal protein L22
VAPDPAISGPPEGGWDSLKVDELKEALEARGLPKSGNKAELVARLEEHEAAGAGDAPTEAAEAAREEGPAGAEATAEVHEVEEAEESEEAEEGEAEPEEGEEPARRRGSAETGVPQERKAPARRDQDGAVVVLARAKYVRSAPRKARLVMGHIRGKRVEQAQAILRHAPRAVSSDILKLLNSAVANAESAYELGPDELRVKRAFVDEGPTIKRFRPRALGRATRIDKRTSHMTIELTTEGNGR